MTLLYRHGLRCLLRHISKETGCETNRKRVSSHMSAAWSYWRQLEDLRALRDMDALYVEYEATSESEGGSEWSMGESYQT